MNNVKWTSLVAFKKTHPKEKRSTNQTQTIRKWAIETYINNYFKI